MTTLVSLTGKEQVLKLSGFYGEATPVHEFEKLNQIGEGSRSSPLFLGVALRKTLANVFLQHSELSSNPGPLSAASKTH
jgi:hypothetical protein